MMVDNANTDATTGADPTSDTSLTPRERERLEAIRSADTLAELRDVMGAPSEHDAYLQAKAEWQRLRAKELGEPEITTALPEDCVIIDGQEFHVAGVTHGDTEAEREFLRDHVTGFIDAGGAVYCEQGIRRMYFDDIEDVCEIDDYRWAMHHCRALDVDSQVDGHIEGTFDEEGIADDLQSVASQFREVTFSLIESGRDVYGDTFASALGDIASTFLMTHEEMATGEDFASFAKSREAAKNPQLLEELQYYYKRSFLPQPLEREWLRRHDRELELFTHARNERIAEYVLYQAPDTGPVHVITGAAHQPGVVYYLDAYRTGEWDFGTFESVP